MAATTKQDAPRTREWLSGFVVLVCLGGVILGRGGEPAVSYAETSPQLDTPAEFADSPYVWDQDDAAASWGHTMLPDRTD